jgi:predicted glycogen debranching enzyme
MFFKGREGLLTHRLGTYASSSNSGCNTRRYHGLLIASTLPPVGRVAALATVMENVTIGDDSWDLSINEFDGAFSPAAQPPLVEFRNDLAPTFVYDLGGAQLTKQIVLADRANTVAVRYTLTGGKGVLRLRPFASLRDFHHLRQYGSPSHVTFEQSHGKVMVQDRSWPDHALYLFSSDATFAPDPQWWFRFKYRQDLSRGQDCYEDLYTPGSFSFALQDGQAVQFNGSLDEPMAMGFETALEAKRRRAVRVLEHINSPSAVTRQLAVSADAFVVERHWPGHAPSATIVAGYPWFADWGRDTFIALPGLLLETGRLDQAMQVFDTFARSIEDGIIPNRFDDYSSAAHYNSIDASLWFILAGERFLEAGGDMSFWRSVILPASRTILHHYQDGTQFDIRADADGLLSGGSAQTQLTWMDAKLGDDVVTPRQGKAVEVNAMWHAAHCILARRLARMGDVSTAYYQAQAQSIAQSFNVAFWNARANCLYDCLHNGNADGSIRPNQILAVSLGQNLLDSDRQHRVLGVVTEHLLTPLGLRSLSPQESRYRRCYGGSWESRDRAYHQGTVWGWLIGPYIDAFLKVNGMTRFALGHCAELISAFDEHLHRACLGQVSEIFAGDWPHESRGCFAQAWSVGELLRVRRILENA